MKNIPDHAQNFESLPVLMIFVLSLFTKFPFTDEDEWAAVTE